MLSLSQISLGCPVSLDAIGEQIGHVMNLAKRRFSQRWDGRVRFTAV